MESFRSHVEIDAHSTLEHSDPIVTLGSCFSEAMGEKLRDAKWNCLNNPFGTQFHPLAIFKLLELALTKQDLPADLFLEDDGASYHYYLPRSFYAADRKSLSLRFQAIAAQLRQNLVHPRAWLLLTFGSAFIYEKAGRWVSNCHQQDGRLFQKRLLGIDEMQVAWEQLAKLLPPHLRIVVSLSPVRHQRDTFPLNSVSKALLRVFMHAMNFGSLRYFPAYEIMLDELRDYRFYKSDHLHPSDEAIAYIWKQFCASAMSPDAEAFLKTWTQLKTRLEHRFHRPDAPASKAFQQRLLQDLEALSTVDLSEEIKSVRDSLQNCP